MLMEVKDFWWNRAIENARAIRVLNAKSGQQDGSWWDPWLRHEQKAKAVKEAAAVVRKYGNMKKVPQNVADHLAGLINKELIDIDVFEALTRPLVAKGDHFSIRKIIKEVRTERRARGDGPVTNAVDGNAEAVVHAATPAEIVPASRNPSTELALPKLHPAEDTDAVEDTDAPLVVKEPGLADKASTSDTDSPKVYIPDDSVVVPESSLLLTDTESVQPTQINTAQPHDSDLDQQSPQATGATSEMVLSNPEADLEDLIYSQQSSTPDHSVPQVTDEVASTTTSESSSPSTATVVPDRDRDSRTATWSSIKWAYKTNTPIDVGLAWQGAWLYDRPSSLARWGQAAAPPLPHGTPIILLPWVARSATPSVSTNGSVLLLEGHNRALRGDSRSIEHFAGLCPDYQTASKLPGYQAIELLGRSIWRHDREFLPCSSPTCQRPLSDMSRSTLICHGCGPKSTIRWCSLDCKLRNLESHGQVCGDPQSLILAIIDGGTAPSRFSSRFSFIPPAIRDKHGLHTVESYRQKVHAQLSTGRYTVFDPQSHEATVLIWQPRYSGLLAGKEVPYSGYALEMEARIERCLNVALFDHHQTTVIEHLFRLLQHLLHLKDSYTPALYHILAGQFRHEFAYDVGNSFHIARHYQGMCECEWTGAARQERHHPGCSRGGNVPDVVAGELFRTRMGVKDVVEGVEKNHWILRAWRCQHPIVWRWAERAAGTGFPGCVTQEDWIPRLGKGWAGMEGEGEDDVCV
ncbi:MAG: hypothetical protein LQ350_003078 [Teloschistes chrysophthalmus]|nr:MAG: hypothetical protein LQ350_003078 [Niorma chrysophthalma]